MTTYLIASNEMMCRILARRMEGQDIPLPVRWHCPEWLTDGDAQGAPVHTIDNPDEAEPLPHDEVDLVLVDCSTADDPYALLNRVHARLAPRRWLVLSDALDATLMAHAARLGASGCLAVPAPVELVCAAAALVWAGGQCFPRSALTVLRARVESAQLPATAADTSSAPVSPPYPWVYPDGSTAIG
jgi:DNA-binding NarL/FixJ family response regulator